MCYLSIDMCQSYLHSKQFFTTTSTWDLTIQLLIFWKCNHYKTMPDLNPGMYSFIPKFSPWESSFVADSNLKWSHLFTKCVDLLCIHRSVDVGGRRYVAAYLSLATPLWRERHRDLQSTLATVLRNSSRQFGNHLQTDGFMATRLAAGYSRVSGSSCT